MASIKKIEGKSGTSYQITVTSGRDSKGKQIRHYKTWAPDRPMTARQMEKEVQRVAVEFERDIELGYQADNRQTFEEYAEYFIDLRGRRGTAPRTLHQYRYFMERVVPAIGHMKLQDIRPQHLNAFYRQLEQPGAQNTGDMAKPLVDFKAMLKARGMTQGELGRTLHISHRMIERLCRGEHIALAKAEIIAQFFGKRLRELFKPEYNDRPLAQGTIRRFHGFISVVLAQAEKEMLIPYNPARKATPPARESQCNPHYFQPEELDRIFEALESEPLKLRALVHLLAVTGCRIGEITGLKWGKVDLDRRQLKIDSSLHYLPDVGAFDGPTKTKNTRVITIPAETVALLRQYRRWQMEWRLKNGDRWTETGYVFTTETGGPIISTAVNGMLARFADRHGLPHINPHAFRHTAASIMISNGVDIVTVSKMLGHANTSMTTDVYSHVIEEAKRNATECIADVILRKKRA